MTNKENLRGRFDILADMVRICTEETRKTSVMYKAGLSYEQLCRYLEELEGKGLIVKTTRDNAAFYYTTEKGREFLDAYEKMKQKLKVDASLLLPIQKRYQQLMTT